MSPPTLSLFFVLFLPLAELSTLLNPGRAQGPTTALSAGRSGGFNGLVRHVVELCAVGELPLELNASAPGQQSEGDQDAPVGCTIEYSLPGVGHVSHDRAERRHE